MRIRMNVCMHVFGHVSKCMHSFARLNNVHIMFIYQLENIHEHAHMGVNINLLE